MTEQEHRDNILQEVEEARLNIGSLRDWRVTQINNLIKGMVKDRIADEKRKAGIEVIEDETLEPDYKQELLDRWKIKENGNGKH